MRRLFYWYPMRGQAMTDAERIRVRRERRLRKLLRTVPDPHSPEVRQRIAEQVVQLDPADEEDALRWIEAVSEFN